MAGKYRIEDYLAAFSKTAGSKKADVEPQFADTLPVAGTAPVDPGMAVNNPTTDSIGNTSGDEQVRLIDALLSQLGDELKADTIAAKPEEMLEENPHLDTEPGVSEQGAPPIPVLPQENVIVAYERAAELAKQAGDMQNYYLLRAQAETAKTAQPSTGSALDKLYAIAGLKQAAETETESEASKNAQVVLDDWETCGRALARGMQLELNGR